MNISKPARGPLALRPKCAAYPHILCFENGKPFFEAMEGEAFRMSFYLWKQSDASLQTYVSHMNPKLRDDPVASSLWDFQFIKELKRVEDFNYAGPCVALAAPGMLQSGMSRCAALRMPPSPRGPYVYRMIGQNAVRPLVLCARKWDCHCRYGSRYRWRSVGPIRAS